MKKIILVFGDPNSINSELIYKSWKKLDFKIRRRIYVIGNYNLISQQFKKLKFKLKLIKIDDINKKFYCSSMKIINVKVKFKNPFNVSFKESSKFVKYSLNLAHKYALSKNVSGLVNCAIDKRTLNLNKSIKGVTEYLALKCGVKDNSEVMLIKSDKTAVCPVTTHLPVKNISKNINKDIIIKKIKTINLWFKKNLNKKPKIAILGLNPHNSEMTNNSEEVKIILPAINKLKKLKINVYGPYVADTIFINDYKKYDVVVGMFHDQVLAPFKSIFKYEAINLTLGLKYIRVSPDHGTAKDLIGKNKANSFSLTKCLSFVSKF